MSLWPAKSLGEVATIFNGKTPSREEQREGGHPVLKIKDVDEQGLFKGVFESFVDDSLAASYSEKMVKGGDTLILNAAHNADYVGSKQFYACGEVDGALATGEWCIVRANQDILDKQYASFFLRSGQSRHEIRKLVKGIHLYPKDVARLQIPLPPLATQQHIARVLEQADQLRKQAQQMERELNQLAQSLFLEMFGDYRKQPEDRFVPLSNIADVVSGVAKGSDLKGKQTRIVPYLRVANVQDGFLDLSEIKEIEATERDIEKYVLQPGDILMTEGGDFDKLGRGAMWSGQVKECIHQNHIFRVRLSNAYEPKFFEYYLRSSKAKLYFLRCAKQTTNLASINMTQLKALPLPKEDRKKQEQFVAALELIERQIQTAKCRGEHFEQAFQALMQRAFNGELTERKAA